MTVSAPQCVAQVSFSTSSATDEVTAEFPMLAFTFTRKARPMAMGSDSGWLTLAGMMARPASHLVAHQGGLDVLTQRHEFHLGGDLPAPGVVQLRHRRAPAGHEGSAPGRREGVGGTAGGAARPGRRRARFGARPSCSTTSPRPRIQPRRNGGRPAWGSDPGPEVS